MGATLSGMVYMTLVLEEAEVGDVQADVYIDDPNHMTVVRTEQSPPYDVFGGTEGNFPANLFDTTMWANGAHSVAFEYRVDAQMFMVSADFNVQN